MQSIMRLQTGVANPTAQPIPLPKQQQNQLKLPDCLEFPGECSRNKNKTFGDSGEDWGWASGVVTGKAHKEVKEDTGLKQ